MAEPSNAQHHSPETVFDRFERSGSRIATSGGIRGSKIWDGDWRKERAAANKIDAGAELEAHYRNRSMLKRDVLPDDIAEAAYWLGSEQSAKSTGNMINVDAGNVQAFTR